MSGTYSYAPCIGKGYNFIFITLVILEEFSMISLFYYTKIPTINIKVLIYSNFCKERFGKK
jgi:hypothetical protein